MATQKIKYTKGVNGGVTCTMTNYPTLPTAISFGITPGDCVRADHTNDRFFMIAKGAPGGEVSFAKGDIDTSGCDPALVSSATADLELEINDNFFLKASSGGGAINFTASDGVNWDGTNQYITLSGDTTLNFLTTRTAGQLRITHNGHGLTLEFADSTTQAFTLTGGSANVILAFEKVFEKYEFEVIKDLVSVDVPLPAAAAPTAVVVDDDANTMSFTKNPLFTADSDYEESDDSGATVSGDMTAFPIDIGDRAVAIGQHCVRVKAVIGLNSASSWLCNDVAFTSPSHILSTAFPSGWTGTVPEGVGGPPSSEFYSVFVGGEDLKVTTAGTVDKFKVYLADNSLGNSLIARVWVSVWRIISGQNANLIGTIDSGIVGVTGHPAGLQTFTTGTPFAVAVGDRISVGWDTVGGSSNMMRVFYDAINVAGSYIENTSTPITTNPKDWASAGGGSVNYEIIPVELWGT